MTIEEIKQLIELKQPLPNKYNIFICKDESAQFIFHQYLNAYLEYSNLSVEFIDDLTAVPNNNLFTIEPKNIKILYVDKLEINYIPSENVWVRCKSIKKDILSDISSYIIEIPKLEQWQLKDYAISKLSFISEKDVEQLVNTHQNIYWLDNDIDKLLLFESVQSQHTNIFNQLYDQLFIDVSEYKIFDLINCFIKYDKNNLLKILQNIDNLEIDIFGLITLLLTNFKRIIDIQLSSSSTPETLGISSKQFWAIKKFSCGIYSKTQLLNIYALLTRCDLFIKTGYISTDMLLNYLIINIMTIKERVK